MAFVRTLLIIAALLVGWTALHYESLAGSQAPTQKSATGALSLNQS